MPDPFDHAIFTSLKWKDWLLRSLHTLISYGLIISQILSNYMELFLLFLCLTMCLCVWRASKRTAHRGQKRVSVLLELELEAFENRPDVDAGKWTVVEYALLTTEPCLQPLQLCNLFFSGILNATFELINYTNRNFQRNVRGKYDAKIWDMTLRIKLRIHLQTQHFEYYTI